MIKKHSSKEIGEEKYYDKLAEETLKQAWDNEEDEKMTQWYLERIKRKTR